MSSDATPPFVAPPRSGATRRVGGAALLLLLALGASACRSDRGAETSAAYPPIVSSDFGEMRNVSVAGPIWFGTFPSREDLELARRRGVMRVIDLASPAEVAAESPPDYARECQRLRIELLAGAIQTEDPQTDDAVDLVLQWLAPKESGAPCEPTLMFDGSGGRCASFLAIHRAVELGVPLEEALVEARRAGMKPGAPEAFVRAQVARLTGVEDDAATTDETAAEVPPELGPEE